MTDGNLFHSRKEFEARQHEDKNWREIAAQHNAKDIENPFVKSSPLSKSLDEIAAQQDRIDPAARLRLEKLRKKRQDKFRSAVAAPVQPKFESWGDEAHEFDLKGSDYFRSMRYAKDINQGLKILEKIPKGVTIFGSRFPEEGSPQYEQARQLGSYLAAAGHPVVTGGGPGIMEAANRGAYEAGGVSVGLRIHLPNMDEEPNNYVTHEMTFHYFFARKNMLINASRLFVFFPGGFGTLDELTEVLVLLQEKKMVDAPIFLVGSQWWSSLHNYFQQFLMDQGFLNPGDLGLYRITDNINDIVAVASQDPATEVALDATTVLE
jgi:uncharacterized protein (TIGR00730 family)